MTTKCFNNDECYSKKEIKKFTKEKKIKNDIVAVNKYMKKEHGCDDYTCWDDHYPEIFSKTNLKAKPVWDKDEWLYNTDIDNVMERFENLYPGFAYLGDWAYDIVRKNYNVEKSQLRSVIKNHMNNTKWMAFIFTMWGERIQYMKHWVVIFVDMTKKQLIFYDSLDNDGIAEREMVPVFTFFKRILGDGWTLIMSDVQTQYDYKSCGILCLYMVEKLLKGWSFASTIDRLHRKSKNRDMLYEYLQEKRKKYYQEI